MAINIGTPYFYRGRYFLDIRQGMPESKADLLNWNTPVPDGFEVCLNKVWYYYDSSTKLPDTGHWIPRLTSSINADYPNNQGISAGLFKKELASLNNVMDEFRASLNAFKDILLKLDNNIYPYSYKTIISEPKYRDPIVAYEEGLEIENRVTRILEAGGWTAEELELYDMNEDGTITVYDRQFLQNMYSTIVKMASIYQDDGSSNTYYLDVGSSTLPSFSWSIQKDGETEEPVINSVTVEGPTVGFLSKDKKSWSSKYLLSSDIKKDEVYKIISNVGTYNQIVIGEAHFKFTDRIYYGAAPTNWMSKTSLSYSDIESFKSVWSINDTLSFETADNTAATIIIPRSQYDPDNSRFYIDGNYYEGTHVRDITVENVNGFVSDYTLVQIWKFSSAFEVKIQQDTTDIQKMFEAIQSVLDIEELVDRKLEIDQENQ